MQFKSTGAKILTHCVIGMIGHKPCSHHHDHEKRWQNYSLLEQPVDVLIKS